MCIRDRALCEVETQSTRPDAQYHPLVESDDFSEWNPGAEAFSEHYSITERDTAEAAMQDAARRALSHYCHHAESKL